MSRIPICFLLAATCCLSPAVVWSQGSAADYQRADQFSRKYGGLVTNLRIAPQWIHGGPAFWYRAQRGPDATQFMLVDPDQAERRVAFDHEQLAQALAKATSKSVRATQLPFRSLNFHRDLHAIAFQAFGKSWQYDVKSNQLTEGGDFRAPGPTAVYLPRKRPSQSSQTETHVTFENVTQAPVKLLWIDGDGNSREYTVLDPAKTFTQHTYVGHVWQATTISGKVLHTIQATRDATVIIDGKPRVTQRQHKPRRNSPSGDKSPDGRWQLFIRDHNVVARAVDSGEETILSKNGNADDPYQGRYYWSPDSRRVVVMQEKRGEKHEVHFVESSPKDQLQPKLHTFHYYKPGDRIPVKRPRLFSLESLSQVPVSEELFTNAWSIQDLRWAEDSSRFTFLFNQRGHQILRVVGIRSSGETQAIVDEVSKTFIDYAGKRFCHYLDDTNELLWMSERDGWNHLYRYDALTGEVKNQITSGAWVVRGVDRVDAEAKQIWFRAGGIDPAQDPYHVHFCRVNFDGSGFVRLTAGDGTHQIEYSPDGRYLIDTYSRVDLPPVTEIRRVTDGSEVCQVEQANWQALLDAGWPTPERFQAKGRDGKTDIYGVIFRPSTFNKEASYPVVEKIYAGPHSAHVPKQFSIAHGAQRMAELGFVVVQIDGMGTSHRSKAFHDVCWKNLVDAGLPDRIAWLKSAGGKYPQMDLDRVGIYGGSAGGQNALAALLTHGDFYKVAVADCGCHDNRMDKIWWNELWMGWPIGPHYAENSNVTLAPNLTGKLMLIVGELDRNVDPASTMQVANALIKADKDFDLIVIPGAGHGAAGTAYGRRRQRDFFVKHLLGVVPRHEPAP